MSRASNIFSRLLFLTLVIFTATWVRAASDTLNTFIESHCADCHNSDTKKGGLDLSILKPEYNDSKTFAMWVKIHDRVKNGEMPPKKKAQPTQAESTAFLNSLSVSLITADKARIAQEGRATKRRMNRYEYEDTLRDLLALPSLQVKEFLPEDGEAYLFNKVGDALDVSHVNMARYLNAADYALRQALAVQVEKPSIRTTKYYARDQAAFAGAYKVGPNIRSTFPLIGTKGQPEVVAGKAPKTVGDGKPGREEEAVGFGASTYEPTEIRFNNFKAPYTGPYKLRFNTYTVWAANTGPEKYWNPDWSKLSPGRRDEPITIYSDTSPRILRKLGGFDATPDPQVSEMYVWLQKGETIRPDAARFLRPRPPEMKNPLAEKDGMPAVAYKWMEVEGPLFSDWPQPGHKLLFGDLLMEPSSESAGKVEILSANPESDAKILLHDFLTSVYRRPASEADRTRFMGVVQHALKDGYSFTDAMIAAYTAVLCSPEFLYIDEKPGKLDDRALAARLSYFLWNSGPDEELRQLAASGKLSQSDVLREQTERLLNDPKSRRFIDRFLDYWLELRKIAATAPDATLYPDYQLDDLLVESMIDETQLFFQELVKQNLPTRNLVQSDFVVINERLAIHYGIPGVKGVALRKVQLPPDSVRGGLMTQASVLKVTANGTTTSPVLRGVWIMERILGQRPPPPPPSVPAVEPDTRGATTIREQLSKHRDLETCAACHKKIDPAGFALESFDTMGAFRDKYRSLGQGPKVKGFGHNGLSFAFCMGLKVDCSGELPDGNRFDDVRELKKLLLRDEEQLARNLVNMLTIYATGAPVQFSDRAEVARILKDAKADNFGVRTLIHELIQSNIFRTK